MWLALVFMEGFVMEEKEKYIEKIMEMLKKINNTKILHCIYVFVCDIIKEE